MCDGRFHEYTLFAIILLYDLSHTGNRDLRILHEGQLLIVMHKQTLVAIFFFFKEYANYDIRLNCVMHAIKNLRFSSSLVQVPFYHVLFEAVLVLWIVRLITSKTFRFREQKIELTEKVCFDFEQRPKQCLVALSDEQATGFMEKSVHQQSGQIQDFTKRGGCFLGVVESMRHTPKMF